MQTVLNRPRRATRPAAPTPQVSDELGQELDRLQNEEQVERDRRREQNLARLWELARDD